MIKVVIFAMIGWTIFGLSEEGDWKDPSTHLRLQIVEGQIEVEGKTSAIYEIRVSDGQDVITRKTGECFNVTVENKLTVPTSLHWHGLITAWQQDGTSYVSQLPIAPGSSQFYNFKVEQTGTYYAHGHYGLEEQKLLSIPLILQPIEPNKACKEIIVYLEDFTFETIDNVWGKLREDLVKQRAILGRNWTPDLSPAKAGHGVHDLSDVVFDTYLTNKKTLSNPDIHKVSTGDEVILRFINASIASQFTINLGELQGKIVAADGNPVVPLITTEVPLATGQRIDVRAIIPKKGSYFPILARAQGSAIQTGLILTKEESKIPNLPVKLKKTAGPVSNDVEKFLYPKYPLAQKKIDRSITIELEGNMMYYVWAINKEIWPKSKPISIKEGQRIELSFINKTTMSHPMHLHGHVFQIKEIDGVKINGALRDTVLVMPGQVVKVVFDANNPGVWPLHCHVGYHAWGGMATVMHYEGIEGLSVPLSTILQYAQLYGGY